MSWSDADQASMAQAIALANDLRAAFIALGLVR
jgi:hypothetical protein